MEKRKLKHKKEHERELSDLDVVVVQDPEILNAEMLEEHKNQKDVMKRTMGFKSGKQAGWYKKCMETPQFYEKEKIN